MHQLDVFSPDASDLSLEGSDLNPGITVSMGQNFQPLVIFNQKLHLNYIYIGKKLNLITHFILYIFKGKTVT
jgi:hypothetical protein